MFIEPTHEEIGTRTFLDGRKVRKRVGNELKIIDGDGLLYKTYRPLAFFFGARWEENSRKCVPFIRNFYEKMKEKGNNFNIIYVSSDDSVEELAEFMQEFPEDCIALYGKYYDDDDEEAQLCWFIRDRYFIRRIPKMFIEFGAHPVYSPMEEIAYHFDFGVYPGGRDTALTDIIEFGEEAWDIWVYPRDGNQVEEKTNYRVDLCDKSLLVKQDYRLSKNCLRTEYSEITRHPIWQPTTSPLAMFSGVTLLRKKGDQLVNETAEEALRNINIIGLYFSSDEFETCHSTIRYLPKCYRKWKANGESVEIIFVSLDESKEQMESCMKLMHDDWLAVPFQEDWKTLLGGTVYFPQYPALIIVNNRGEIITREGGIDLMIEEKNSIDYWKQGNPAVSYDDFIERDVAGGKRCIYETVENSKKERDLHEQNKVDENITDDDKLKREYIRKVDENEQTSVL